MQLDLGKLSDDETQELQFEELPIVESSRPKRGRGPTTGKSLIPPLGHKWLCKWESQAPGVFDDILNVMKERYVFRYVEGDALVPDEVMKNICKRSLRLMVKNWKRNLKKKYDKKDEEARKICPDSRLTQAEWELLMKYWAKPKVIESFLGSYLSAHRKKDESYSNDYTRENCVEVERIFHKNHLQQSQEITDLPPSWMKPLDAITGGLRETPQTLGSRRTCNRKWEIVFAWNKIVLYLDEASICV
ncbi:hypothetical protein H6P81_006034 [Aristolochia fimbriata]|uniref:Transposase n=1 Tax=Aristolochia fimbriata TaxID=158543 RepID=A0AAV7EYD2_ARIFI|nr:hypothetical protein H6P81_006034 [Aristolochia fimbriata]